MSFLDNIPPKDASGTYMAGNDAAPDASPSPAPAKPVDPLTAAQAGAGNALPPTATYGKVGYSTYKDANNNEYEKYVADGTDAWGKLGDTWLKDKDGNWFKFDGTNAHTAAPTWNKDPKAPKDLKAVRFEERADGTYAVDINSNGTPGTVVKVDGVPPKVNVNQNYKSAPDGLHEVDSSGHLGALVVPKTAGNLDPNLSKLRGMQIGKVEAETGKITTLLPFQQAQLEANTKLAGARTTQALGSAKYSDARADTTLSPIWSRVESDMARLQEMRDAELKANPDQTDAINQKYDSVLQTVWDSGVREAKLGMTTKDAGNIAQNVYSNQVTQGDNRATTAGSIYDNQSKNVFDAMTKYGVGGSDMFKGVMGELLGGAPGFQKNMGGAPVDPGGFLTSILNGGNTGGNGSPNRFEVAGGAINQPTQPIAGGGAGNTSVGGVPGMTWDPNTNNTHQTGAAWNGEGWTEPTGGSGMAGAQSGTAPTSNFLNGGAGSAGMQILMNVFKEAQDTGQDHNVIAQKYLDQMKAAGVA